MSTHLAIVCVLPTALFAGGAFFYVVGNSPNTEELRSVGKLFMGGAIAIVLQSLYSLYLG